MGTALALLVLLALGAIPGAMLPQRALNQAKVDEYLAEHSTIGPWLDRVQAFDVFSSFWFTAIYVLLFVSLVGCIIPRTVEHAKALRTQPVPVPRNLGRLPKHAEQTVTADQEELAETISARLRGWRRSTREKDGITEISAEKGYLREFGNLVFHLSLVGLLVAFAVGKLFGYEGNVIVIANGGRDSARHHRRPSTRSGPVTPSTAPTWTRCVSRSRISRPPTLPPGRRIPSNRIFSTRPATIYRTTCGGRIGWP
ncbi:resB-like family protein [Mycobacteroides abscessus subsp. bolletii 1513]|uniref:ResB-like family protein n=1 Tax=Mycobacteroides abscessus subsp. bolletii 1513 TaxID=1299321 RepID=X8DD20_9MYCO|nr:resB-like family protein [Mycobacteroides abscessus subsp. bolletii 1513]